MADAVLEARKGRGLEPEPSSRPQLDTAKGALPQVSRENLYQQNCCEPLTEKGAAHKLNGLNLLSRDPDRLNSIEELGRFKELGYKVLIAPDGFVTGQDHADIFSDVAAKAGIKREPINAKDARSALQTEHGSDRELPPSLGSQEGKVIYRPYAFRSYEIGGNKALVQVLSELPGKGQSILLQKRIPLKGGKIEGEAMEELAGELAETLKRKQTDLEKIA
ncbi:MAG: hypothetical protein DCC75_02185, partial [Proteobacteria bacterium]